MEYKTYLFDFDGTLVDSMPTFVSVMLRVLDENNVKYGKDIIKTITPLGCAGTAEYFVNKLGLSMSVESVVELIGRYIYDEYAYRIVAKEGVVETLYTLKDMGAELNVLTASPHAVLDVCLERLGILDLFTNVWSCDDFGTTKSDVGIYKMAAEKIGKPIGEILFLDDNYNADLTAVNAGMRVCGVYDESSRDYENDIRQIAHHYITSFPDLLTL